VLGAADATAKKPASAPAAGKKAPPAESPFIKRYRTFCYRLIGERFDRRSQVEDLAERLKQAGVNATPGMHRAVLLVSTLIAAIASTAVCLILFLAILREPLWYEYTGVLVLITVLAVSMAFRSLVGTRIVNRKEELDRELPFTLSEMSVMASTGMSPIQLIHRMARRDHDPAMTGEFKKIVYKTDIQGKDIISALAETAKESPSNAVREAFWDMGNMIHQGGNLDEYLRAKSDDVLKLKRLAQREFIDRLSTFLDMYVSLVLIGVLMIAVGAYLINAFGSTAAGLNANELLELLAYGIVPLSVIMTTLLISIAYARAE
jgi:archaeal flagellar protein FlaJ